MTTPTMQGPMNRTGSKVPKGYKQFQLQNMTPEQMEQMQQLFQHVSPDSYLGKLAGGDQEAFAEMEAPAMRQFSALQGNIASRFSGMGQGARRSSGFQNTMNQASSDFAQDLASKRMQTRKDSIQELMKYSEMLMGQKPYETGLVQKEQKQNPWGAIVKDLAGSLPGAIVSAMTGSPIPSGGSSPGVTGGASRAIQSQNSGGNPGYGGSGQYNFPSFGV